MSIEDPIRRALDAGDLWFLPMRIPGNPIRRVMLLEKEIRALLEGPFQDAKHERRIGRLAADMESFVMGEEISMSFTPYDHKSAYMGLLDPVGQATWDIRSRDPDPGIRVFGRFVEQNVFIALGWSPRSTKVPWSKKEALEDKQLRWRIAILDCDEKWNRILPGLIPVAGDKVENYVGENVIVV